MYSLVDGRNGDGIVVDLTESGEEEFSDSDDDVMCDFDDILFCDACLREWEGDCPVHGPLLIVKDTPALADYADPLHAIKTAPFPVRVSVNESRNGTSGVWAQKAIPARTRFGPFRGRMLPVFSSDSRSNEDQRHTWTIFKSGAAHRFVDGKDPGVSNWMRYVRRACSNGEQNLNAFQYFGRIFYRTARPVAADEELVVWYSDQFGRPTDLTEVCTDENCSKMKSLCPVDCPYACSTRLRATENYCHIPANNGVAGETSEKVEDGVKTERVETSTRKTKHTEKSYKCTSCNKQFVLAIAFKMHKRKHSSQKPFTCAKPVYSRRSPDKSDLDSHTIEKSFALFACRMCNRQFSRKSDLVRHMNVTQHKKETPILSFACSSCNRQFSRKCDLARHINVTEHSKESSTAWFACSTCNRQFSRKSDLSRHMTLTKHNRKAPSENSEIARHLTEHNRETSSEKSDFASHLTEHNRETSSEKSEIARHLTEHSRETSSEKSDFARHLTEHSRETSSEKSDFASHLTEHSRETSSEKSDFASHLTEHSRETSSEKSDFASHLTEHNRETSSEKSEIARHLTEHNRETSSEKSGFARHLTEHNREKPFACVKCENRFSERRLLISHVLSHSKGRDRVVCVLCRRHFTRRCHLYSHLKWHFKESFYDYACAFCGGRFSKKHDLDTHLRQKHGSGDKI